MTIENYTGSEGKKDVKYVKGQFAFAIAPMVIELR